MSLTFDGLIAVALYCRLGRKLCQEEAKRDPYPLLASEFLPPCLV